MNRKQFILLIVALAILGGIGIALMKRDEASWSGAGNRIGQNLLKGFDVNNVASITVKNNNGVVNLERKDGTWQLKERAGYPANFQQISELLLKLQDFKVVQSESITPEQRPQMELLEAGKGEHSATQLEFKDQAGKSLATVLLGKKYMRSQGGSNYPAGRYVAVAGEDKYVSLINDPLMDIDAKVENWISKDFMQVDKLHSVAVTDRDGTMQWKMSRETDPGLWKLAEPKAGEDFDPVNGTAIANTLTATPFVDVVVNADPAKTGLDKPVTAIAETFDGLTYTIKVGKEGPDNTHHMSFVLSGEPKKERTADPAEKPEDKAKRDKAFQDDLKKQLAKIKREQALAKWVYLVPNWKVEPILKTRDKLMKEKKPVMEKIPEDKQFTLPQQQPK